MRVTAAILALVGLGFFAGGVYRELRGDGGGAGGLPVLRYDLRSTLLGRTLHEVAVVPPKPRAPGLVVLLHAQPPRPRLLTALRDLGPRAPVVLLAGGAPGGAPRGRYGSYVLVEAIPDALKRFQLDGRIALGGPGAPTVARLDPSRVCASRASLDVRPLVRALAGCGRS